MSNFTKKLVKNSFYGILEFGWPIILSLAATPFIVHKLGVDAFGILALVSVTLGFFGVLDLGLTGASIKYIAEYYEKKDNEMINRVISSTILVYFLIGVLVVSLILGITNTLVTQVLKVPISYIEVTKFAFYLAAFGFMLNLILGVFAAIPKAAQRYDISTKISIFIGTFSVVATVSLLYLGYGLKELVILGLVVSILGILIYYWIDKKILPSLEIRLVLDKKLFSKLFKFGSFFLLASLSAVILFHLDKLIIGSVLGISVVTFYVIPGNIASKIQGFINSAANVVFPASAVLDSQNNKEKLHKLYFEGSRMVLILATMLSVPLIVFADKFLFYWIGNEFAIQSSSVMRILVLTYYLLSIGTIIWAISFGKGRSKINAFFAFFTAFLNIAFLVFMIKPWGIVGAALAYLLSAVISVPLMIGYIERKVLRLSGFKFWVIFSKIFIVAVIQASIALVLRIFVSNIFIVLAFMGISAFSFLFIYYLLGFFEEGDRKLLNIFLEKLGFSKN